MIKYSCFIISSLTFSIVEPDNSSPLMSESSLTLPVIVIIKDVHLKHNSVSNWATQIDLGYICKYCSPKVWKLETGTYQYWGPFLFRSKEKLCWSPCTLYDFLISLLSILHWHGEFMSYEIKLIEFVWSFYQ